MFSRLKSLLGLGPTVDYAALIRRGAVILDVRTKEEYQSGNVKGSINIPVQELQQQMLKLNKSKPIITCCASGIRSSTARSLLISNGFTEVVNGGSWYNLKPFEK
jgi:rhodanese-related sulfurtransferase